MFFAKQRLKTLERNGTEPELARALAEAISRSNPTVIELERSRIRSKELAQRNRLLAARYSARRYRLADAIVDSVLKIPGLGRLARRKDASA